MGYLLESESRAFCIPAFDVSSLSPAQLLRIQGVHLGISDWEDLFHDLSRNSPHKWLLFEETVQLSAPPVPPISEGLLSPLAHEKTGGLLGYVPS